MPERKYSPEIEFKSQKELGQQFKAAQETLGKEPEVSLIPLSEDKKDTLKMSVDKIKQKYKQRYEMYVKLVRDNKYHQQAKDPKDPESYLLFEEDIEEMKKWLTALNSLDDYIEAHKEGEIETLRDRQFTVFEDIRKFLEAGGKEGYVKLPTGVGKTVLFTELIEALNLKTLIVVPTKLLIKQTAGAIEEFASDLDQGKIYANAKEYGRQVSITTYDSLVSQVEKDKIDPNDFDCLILDEAHVSLSKKRAETIKKFKQGIKIGFSATPEYSSDKKVSNLLEKEIHRMDLKEAVEEGLLSPFSAVVAKTEVDISKVKIKESGEYDERELERAVNVASRNQAAVELYKEAFDGQLAVAYCVGVKHASTVAAVFRRSGVTAAHISGDMSETVQQAILKKFHTGEIKVLCNADLLIAGFNEPQARVCLNLRPTRSRVVAEQRGGRVLRLDKKDINKHASVIDFLDQGINLKRPPILFADVAGGAKFRPKKKGPPGGGGGGVDKPGGEDDILIIDIPGLEVITDVEEVMKIVGLINKEKEEAERFKYNEFTAVTKLEEAFAKWQSMPEESRGEFNTGWLVKNGYSGLYDWTRENISIVDLVAKSEIKELRDNFVKLEEHTEVGVLRKLEEAFAKWQSMPEESRGEFNSIWFRKNGYRGLYNWAQRNVSFIDLVAKSNNKELKKSFIKQASRSYVDYLDKLEEAFAKWQSMPENKRGTFNTSWLKTNGYDGLYSWTKRNIPLVKLVAKSNNKELKKSFIKNK